MVVTSRVSSSALLKKFALMSVVLLSLLIYWLYAWYVLSPGKFGFFSLIDDGQTIQNSLFFQQCLTESDCSHLSSVIFETQFGRFRPVYWIVQALLHFGLDFDANALHLVRVYGLGTVLVLLLNMCIHNLKGNWLGHLLGTSLFFTNFSFTENFLRLGPGEPYQLLFLVCFSLIYLSRPSKPTTGVSWTSAFFLLVFALLMALTKETTLALLPVLSFMKIDLKQKIKWSGGEIVLGLVIMSVIIGGIWLARPSASTENYVSNYSITFFQILKNAQGYASLLSQMLFPLLPLVAVLLGLSLIKKLAIPINRETRYWLLIFIFFTLILIPWGFIFERYLLISVFSFALVSASLISQLSNWCLLQLKQLKILSIPQLGLHLVVGLVLFWLGTNLFFLYLPNHLAKTLNYVSWYSQFLAFQHREVELLSKTPEPVYLNAVDTLENWEVLFEIPLHLSFFYNQESKVELMPSDPSTITHPAYLFTSTSLQPVVIPGYVYEKDFLPVSYESLEVSQIDLKEFVHQFKYRPLATLAKPPLTDNPIKHWSALWERRQ